MVREMVIEKYNEDWKKQFYQVKKILEKKLTKIVKIEHVGSTAIEGMCGKPIIDITIIINKKSDFNRLKKELESIDYFHKGDQGIDGREVFERENSHQYKILDTVNHHLYVCTQDNEELEKEILFRNFLNKDEKTRKEYYDIKMEIIGKIGNKNQKSYVSMKSAKYSWFFEDVIKKAKMEKNKN